MVSDCDFCGTGVFGGGVTEDYVGVKFRIASRIRANR